MEQGQLNWVANFIWGIADDVLRDLYVRGKYRDVILPMTVLRRLDAVLEPTKQAVLDMKASLDKAGITNQDQALRQAAGQAFYNTSKFTLRDLKARASQQQLKADFEAYLDGFSPNVQDILDNFEFRNQIPRLSKADALGTLIEKFTSPDIDLSPSGLDNHGMGTVFEELVRRFNEENNEEAGEHWTPRDAVKLMAKLIFLPVADEIESGTYLLYDGACGTGGMLTVAEETLQQLAAEHGKQVATHLYGQEINAETYAICKADLLLKGEGDAADNIVGGPEHSTLANDAFPSREFDFMLSNPPYGKSWKSDLERMGGKDGIKDPRFVIEHAGDAEYSLVTRSSDGQMLFLANMLSKMKQGTKLGSRIAEVHNGSSLFTGDAGQGESNIRRWIIENDWLEAIVALPLNMFYNTGIATYIWVLTNRKPAHRRGKRAADRRDAVVQAAAQEPRQEELRAVGRGHPAHLRHVPGVRGDRAVEDLPERGVRLLEGDGRAAAAPEGHRPGARLLAEGDQGAEGDRRARRGRAAGDPEDPQEGHGGRPAARPVLDDDRRQAGRRRVRARPGSARHRAGAAARRGRHRGVPAARGAAARAGRLVRRRTASRPATRSASPATSTSRSRCGRSKRSAPTSWRWRRRPRACSRDHAASSPNGFRAVVSRGPGRGPGACARRVRLRDRHQPSAARPGTCRQLWRIDEVAAPVPGIPRLSEERTGARTMWSISFARFLTPARFVGRCRGVRSARQELNTILAFSGFEDGADGQLRQIAAATTLDEAEKRVRTIRMKFQGRRIHSEGTKDCRTELMQDNYFHAVFEATKGLAQRLRDLTDVQTDGAALIDTVFSIERPILAMNALRSETEKSEHKGFAALLKGCFAAVRNPLAHEPKILWDGEDDAADYLSLISLLHRKLDQCVPTGLGPKP